jgi:hypothetical protein
LYSGPFVEYERGAGMVMTDTHRMKRAVFAVLAAFVALCLPLMISAANTAVLRVTVRDAKSHAALPLAGVATYGPRSRRGLTGTDGVVPFEASPLGSYELVVSHDGYVTKIVHDVRITGDVFSVTIELDRAKPSFLRQIGRTKTDIGNAASSTQTSRDSVVGIESLNIVDAVSVLPGIVPQIDGQGETLSIFGHPANQTSVSIDGVPVSAFGNTANLQAFSLDLFQSVQIDHQSALSSSGGNVNFDTRNPTLDWIGTSNGVSGSYGNTGLSVTEAGTDGRLGISVAYAERGESGPLNGMRFLDSSGLSYTHDDLSETTGDAVKLRYPFSANDIVVASFVNLDSSSPLICTQFTGVVPCGYGPRNFQNNTIGSAQLRDLFVAGRLSAAVSIFHNDSNLDVDQSGRYIGGILSPQGSSARTGSSGTIVDGQYQVGSGYPINFKLTSIDQMVNAGGNAFGSVVPLVASSVNFLDASVSGEIYNRRRVSSTLTIGEQQQGGQSNATQELSVRYRPSNSDTFTLDTRNGSLNVPPITFSGLADPSALAVDCGAHDAVGFGPSSGSADSSNSTTTLSLEHKGRKVSGTFTARHEVDRNGPITALVRGSSLSNALFPPSYLASATENFVATCGAFGPVSPADLFFGVTAAVPMVIYNGGEAALHVDASRNVTLDLSYGATLARAFGAGGLLFSNVSTVVSGRQLPNQPVNTANLAATAALGRGGVRALANLNYVGVNNPNNLPAYATFDVGLDSRFQHGDHLTLSVLNAFGSHGGTFATNAGAVPLNTLTGPFQTVAQPLQPRTVSLSLRIPFGIGAGLDDVPDYDAGPGVFGYRLYPYPNGPAPDPFAIDRRSGRCGPENASAGTHYLGVIKAYATRIEEMKMMSGAYPESLATEIREGVVMTYHRNVDSYVLVVSLDKHLSFQERLPIARPLAGCSRYYSGTLVETQRRNLYIPSYDEQQDLLPLAEYAPQVGFYVPPSVVENDSFFPAYVEAPQEAPADPFELSSGPDCTPNVRMGARAFIELVRPYIDAFYGGKKELSVPPGFRITPSSGNGAGTRWLTIEPPDVSVKLLSTCIRIAGVRQETLDRLHIGGTVPPSLDFYPQLGFYNK